MVEKKLTSEDRSRIATEHIKGIVERTNELKSLNVDNRLVQRKTREAFIAATAIRKVGALGDKDFIKLLAPLNN